MKNILNNLILLKSALLILRLLTPSAQHDVFKFQSGALEVFRSGKGANINRGSGDREWGPGAKPQYGGLGDFVPQKLSILVSKSC